MNKTNAQRKAFLENRVHVVSKENGVFKPINTLEQLTEQYNDLYDAFYVCDVGEIIRRYSYIRKAMPRVDSYYAVKCNHEPMILKTLAALGAGFDCASKQEMEKVLELNVPANKIIYANTIKTPSYLRYAAAHNIKKMTFDSEDELLKIKRISPNAELVLRFKCDALISERPMGRKFGCEPYNEAKSLLKIAKDLEMNVIGVAFHVGSGCDEPEAYARALSHARKLFDHGYEMGFNFSFLDIGGGLWGKKDDDISPFANVITNALDQYFGDYPDIQIISELGRYYACAAFTLTAKILGRKLFYYDNCKIEKLQSAFYYIHEGVYTSFAHIKRKPTISKKYTNEETVPSTIWGCTCDSYDKVVEDFQMPKFNTGDWLMFENMGAYTSSMNSEFNGFPRTPTIYIIDENMYESMMNSMDWAENDFNSDTLFNNKKSTNLFDNNLNCSIHDKINNANNQHFSSSPQNVNHFVH